MNRKIQTLLGLLVIASIVLTACGPAAATATEAPAPEATDAQEATAEPTADPFSPLNVTGDVITAGSSTVFPLSERMAERFAEEGFSGTVTVDSIGTGGGFERFCEAGETDIANASRGINDDEAAACEAIGRSAVEFRVGTDALAVVVSAENDFATDVTLEELAAIWSTAVNWSDVRAEWPNEPIERFSPGTDSGTYDYFVEVVLDDDAALIQNSANTQYSEDDNVLVQGVLGSPYAIGYFGFAYYVENQDTLTALSIGGVEPNEASAADNSYPLSRPLFLYSDAFIMQSKPQVAAFIHFYLTNVGGEVIDVGYFPAHEDDLQAAWDAFWAAMGASVEAPAEDPLAALYSPLNVSGDVITAGSSTVFPLSERMAERFAEEGFAGTVTVDSIGTGGGFERFCEAGETDIANASRGINEDEAAACTAIGRTPLEFRVGTDAIAVVVSTENDFATDVTAAELAAIWSTAVNWSDVRAEWPNEPIERFSPGTDSGTYDYFVEVVLDDDAALIQNSANTQYSEDDNVLVQGVLGSPYAIGYFGFAYFVENQDTLKALAIDGVEPNEASAADNSYPLSRPLFLYSDATIMTEKPQVAAFIYFYLHNVDDEVIDVGYFPASDADLQAAWDAFEAAVAQ